MCGRYAASRRPNDLVEEFEFTAQPDHGLPPRYNIAPTDEVYAVLERASREDPTAPPVRQLRVLRWGLVPSWSKDPSGASRMINARLETVQHKPAFRKAFLSRRCLLPADGYFEWYAEPGGGKQPFLIRQRDGGVLAMAGLYEFWRDPSQPEDHPDAWLTTCCVITTEAIDELGRLHDRMPMFVERERYASWLDPADNDVARLRSLLVPAAPGRLVAFPVSKDVGNVRNDGAHLVDPLPMEDLDLSPDASPPAAIAEQEQLF